MTTDNSIREAHAAVVRAIADLRAANIDVPMALFLAVCVLRPEDPPATAFRGEGHTGAI
jgi:hypothetical protein